MRGRKTSRMGLALLLFVLFLFAFTAWGAEDGSQGRRVWDMAGVLDEAEEARLEERIARSREELQLDMAVVTADDTEGRSGQDFADRFYEDAGLGWQDSSDGILFLLDMEHREMVLSTSGRAMRIFTDARLDAMLDRMYEGAAAGDYAASAEAFLDGVEDYARQGIPAGQYNYEEETGAISRYRSLRWYEVLLALAAAAFAAGTSCMSVRRQYAMEPDQRQVNALNLSYQASCGFAYDTRQDRLLNKSVASVILPRSRPSGSGPRRSGGASSRRSTVHRSSGGRRHGGRSRRF